MAIVCTFLDPSAAVAVTGLDAGCVAGADGGAGVCTAGAFAGAFDAVLDGGGAAGYGAGSTTRGLLGSGNVTGSSWCVTVRSLPATRSADLFDCPSPPATEAGTTLIGVLSAEMIGASVGRGPE